MKNIICFLLLSASLFAQTVQVATGAYTGDGNDDRLITIGFEPDWVIVKKNGGTADYTVFRTTAFGADSSMGFAAAETATGNKIQSFATNGFVIGTDQTVNTAAAAYVYFAMSAPATVLEVGKYIGNATDNRDIVLDGGFQPAFVMTSISGRATIWKGATAHQTPASTVSSSFAGLVNTIWIKQFNANGFRVGSHNDVNATGEAVYYVAIKSGAWLANGEYTGNGADDRNISYGSTLSDAKYVSVTTSQTGVSSVFSLDGGVDLGHAYLNAAPGANRIQSFSGTGYQVGSNVTVNANTIVYNWFAISGYEQVEQVSKGYKSFKGYVKY